MAVVYMTAEGLQKMKDEVVYLEGVERPRVIQAIQEARDKGDLSENAEYDAAKEEQGKLEARIATLRASILEARIIDESRVKTDTVQLLTKVEIEEVKTKRKMAYQIVAESEANIKEGKLSVTTPIAKGLLGKKVNEVAQIQLPTGVKEFKVLSISL